MEIDRFKSLRDNLQLEINELKTVITGKENEIVVLNETIATSSKAISKVEITVKEQKFSMEKLHKEVEAGHIRYAKMQDEFDNVNFNFDKTKKQLGKMAMENKLKEDELHKIKAEYERINKCREQSDKRIILLEENKEQLKGDNEKIKHLIIQMEREVDDAKKCADEYKRNFEKLTRDKDIMTKNILRQQGVQRDQLKLIKIQQQAKRKLESEIYNYVIDRGNTTKQIKYLEKERDRLVEEHLELTKKIEDYMDEFKLKKVTPQSNY